MRVPVPLPDIARLLTLVTTPLADLIYKVKSVVSKAAGSDSRKPPQVFNQMSLNMSLTIQQQKNTSRANCADVPQHQPYNTSAERPTEGKFTLIADKVKYTVSTVTRSK
eukprot:g34393.t1